ncbi:MAG: hypothetical protein LBE79_13620 [Tannerella sp.]|jgi:hypothetical protein|nr:hypothetical protein [Tannerella sp.]
MDRKFKFSDVLRTAWKAYISQIWLLTGLVIGFVIVSLALILFIPSPLQGTVSISGIAILLLVFIFSQLFSLGYTKNMFQALDGEEPQFSAYGQESRKIITWLLSGLIYLIIVLIGSVFLIVPGFYFAIRLQFFSTSIVEEDTGVITSLKRSWEITKKQEVPLLLLLLLTMGICILGLAFFVAGIFIAGPLTGLIYVYVFRKLTDFSTEEVQME